MDRGEGILERSKVKETLGNTQAGCFDLAGLSRLAGARFVRVGEVRSRFLGQKPLAKKSGGGQGPETKQRGYPAS